MQYTLNYTVDKKCAHQISKDYFFKILIGKKYKAYIALVLLTFLTLYISYTINNYIFISIYLTLDLIEIITVSKRYYLTTNKKLMRAAVKRTKNRSFEINDETLMVSTDVSFNKLYWEDVTRIVITKNVLFIISSTTLFSIPKKDISNDMILEIRQKLEHLNRVC